MSPMLFALLAGPAAQVPPAPIAPADNRALLVWRPGEVRCGDRAEPFLSLQRPAYAIAWTGTLPSVTLRFRIDASGRPLGIARAPTGYVPNGEDVTPALVASRFAAGAERANCTLTYAAERVPFADAPVEAWIAYSIQPTGGTLPKAAWDRIFGAGATCNDAPRPEPLLRAYPAFRTLPATPGARAWTMVGFDIDKDGRPVRVHRVEGSGNAALDRASIDAVTRSRFTPGARSGCRYPYWRGAGTLAAPEPPSEASLRPADATCPATLPFARQPTMTTPQAYNRRNIEGWAVIAYDVAPWGGIGNLRVLAAEPSADFGDWATNVLREAAKAPSSTGYTGCIDRVRFRIGEEAKMLVGGEQAPPDAPPPVD